MHQITYGQQPMYNWSGFFFSQRTQNCSNVYVKLPLFTTYRTQYCKGPAALIISTYLPLYVFVENLPDDSVNGWNMQHTYCLCCINCITVTAQQDGYVCLRLRQFPANLTWCTENYMLCTHIIFVHGVLEPCLQLA